jgi:hypothetical protein
VGWRPKKDQGRIFLELSSLRNTRKRDKPKKAEGNWHRNVCRFFWGKFSTWTFCKNICMVFLNSSCRKTPKNVLKKSRQVSGWVWDLANTRGGPSISFWRPLVCVCHHTAARTHCGSGPWPTHVFAQVTAIFSCDVPDPPRGAEEKKGPRRWMGAFF